MNIKLYKKHSMQSAIALGGKHHYNCISCILLTHTLGTFCACSASHLLHNHISYHCQPIVLVTNVICFIDQTDVKSFFILRLN